jgi:hypothetical protein
MSTNRWAKLHRNEKRRIETQARELWEFVSTNIGVYNHREAHAEAQKICDEIELADGGGTPSKLGPAAQYVVDQNRYLNKISNQIKFIIKPFVISTIRGSERDRPEPRKYAECKYLLILTARSNQSEFAAIDIIYKISLEYKLPQQWQVVKFIPQNAACVDKLVVEASEKFDNRVMLTESGNLELATRGPGGPHDFAHMVDILIDLIGEYETSTRVPRVSLVNKIPELVEPAKSTTSTKSTEPWEIVNLADLRARFTPAGNQCCSCQLADYNVDLFDLAESAKKICAHCDAFMIRAAFT